MQTNSYALIGYSWQLRGNLSNVCHVAARNYSTTFVVVLFAMQAFSFASTLSEDEEKTIASERYREEGNRERKKDKLD